MITKIYVTYGAAAAVGTLAATVGILLGLLTLGLIPVIAGASSQFSVLGDDIKDATSSLRSFNRESSRVGSISPGMDGPQYTMPSASGGSSSLSSGSGFSQTTIVAPDQETGTAVANTASFINDGGSNEESQANDRLHSI